MSAIPSGSLKGSLDLALFARAGAHATGTRCCEATKLTRPDHGASGRSRWNQAGPQPCRECPDVQWTVCEAATETMSRKTELKADLRRIGYQLGGAHLTRQARNATFNTFADTLRELGYGIQAAGQIGGKHLRAFVERRAAQGVSAEPAPTS
jgi:hypothetical protein